MKKILVVNGMIVAGLFIMFAIFASRPEQVPQQAAPPPTPKSGACVIDGVVDCAKARAAWIKTHPKEYAVEQERDRRAQKDVETKAQSKAQQEDAYRAAQVGAIMLRR